MVRCSRHPSAPASAAVALLLVLAPLGGALAHGPLHERIEHLTAQLAAHPDDAGLWLERAELHRLHGDPSRALRDLQRAASLDPRRPGIALCKGVLALDAGRFQDAIPALREAVARAPHDGDAAWWLARALRAAGQPGEAAEVMERALPLVGRQTPQHYLDLSHALVIAAPERSAEAARWLDRGIERLGAVASLVQERARLAPAVPASAPAPAPAPAAAPVPAPASAPVAALSPSTPAPLVAPTMPALGAAAATSPTASATVATRALLPRKALWRYWAAASAPAAGWTLAGFDDAAWPTAQGHAGYGDPFILSPVPYGGNPAAKWITTYFRAAFDVTEDPAALQRLLLRASYDDGIVVFLNGQEVARREIAAGAVSWETLATEHEAGAYDYEPIDLTPFLGLLVQGGNVLAVEVHQSSVASSDLAWDADLAASTAGGIPVRGPYLQLATPGSIVVRWRTDAPTDSRVRFGAAPGNLLDSVADAALTTEHELTLTGLEADTRYFYAVGTSAADLAGDDADHTFVTPPVPGTAKRTRVWVLGDSGGAGVSMAAVRDGYAAFAGTTPTDLWLMLGDNAYYSGTDLEYQAAVFEMFPPMLRTVCLWPTRGNHDFLHQGSNNDYYDIFTLPTLGQAGGEPSGDEAYYAFDYANIHFICLDSQEGDTSPGGAMLDWLQRDLAATNQRWIIAFWHHPPYSKGSHDSDDPLENGGRLRAMRENVLPLLEAGGVDVVLCGHSHSYERSCLLHGHYDVSSTLQPQMLLDPGDGRYGGDGPYRKPVAGHDPHDGAVYVVAGSSTFTGGGSLDHPVMIASLNLLGSLVVEVDGDRLDATFRNTMGGSPDGFTILKGTPIGVAQEQAPRPSTTLGLAPAVPNPFAARTAVRYVLPRRAQVSLTVIDARGRRVATLASQEQEAGEHVAHWDGRDDRGRPVAAGAYTTLLRVDGERRTGKLIVVR